MTRTSGIQFGLVLTLLGAIVPALAADIPLVVRAGGYVAPNGKIKTPGIIVIADGRITQVEGEIPAGAAIDEYPRAVISPGLIDCHGALGVRGGTAERDRAMQPAVSAADAFNAHSSEYAAALAAGVTTFALAPDDENIVGGQIAVCQTSGPAGEPRVLDAAGPLKLSLSPLAFKTDREPTSRIGALGMLRRELQTARDHRDTDTPLDEFARGKLRGVLTAPAAADVLAAVDLVEQYGLKLAIRHSAEAHRVAAAVGPLAGVVVGPFDLSTPYQEARAGGLFHDAKARVAIAGDLPSGPADSLRIGAMVATRAGLPRSAARRAITRVPAEILGVADRVGIIKVGQQADLVVFSGDPLDLRSRVLAVYVDGRRVYFPSQPQEVHHDDDEE